MESIKSYYFTKDEVIIRTSNNRLVKEPLTANNIKDLIATLDKQIHFNINEVNEKMENEYGDLLTKAIVGAVVEGIIALSVFLSFTGGIMPVFLGTLILSIGWFSFLVKKSFKELIDFKNLISNYKIYQGRQILIDKYNSLVSTNDTVEILNVY